ncbi:unnamed protein product [Closterium sp. NIES-53]
MAVRAAVVALVVARCCMPLARAAPVVDAEMETLANLANAWSEETRTWMRDRDCDSMENVKCDGDGHVIALSVTGCALFGSLPTALLIFSHLKNLSLDHCDQPFLRWLPGVLGRLPSLMGLHLTNHRLSGELPAWILSLTDLTSLTISRNKFSGSIPEAIRILKQLQKLVLQEEELSGSIPEAIGALTNLQDLELQDSRLSGTIPACIAHLTALTTLYLNRNNLSGSIPEAISSLKELRELDLSENRLAGTIPAAITTLTSLEYLSLDRNQLTGELPSFYHMARLASKYGLSADHNYLTATADAVPFDATGLDNPADYHSLCLFSRNCLANDSVVCGSDQRQRRASECRAFCGAQPLTPPCSGHGVCSFEPDRSELPSIEPEGQCVCDEGYTPGTKAGTCVSHGTAVLEMALSALHAPQNLLLLLLLPLALLLLLAFKLPQLLRRLKNRPPTRYLFSKRALAARQAAMSVDIIC